MHELGTWLESISLGAHAELFARERIGFDVLPQLSEQDLKELGLPLGDRKRLLKAVAELGGPSPDPMPRRDSERAVTVRSPLEAERRQLTILFADLVGSTALSAALDPEEMREVLRAYQNAVAGEVARFEGHVAKFMGDGVLAYFGWPRAHEDDAERAGRAGLAVVDAAARLRVPGGEPLAARVGIATGLVVVGDLIGEGAAREEAVVGETPNLAARLQSQAGPGQVIVAEGTRRLIGGLFEVEDVGPCHLQGFAQPVRAFRVVGLGRAESRFEGLHADTFTPLVGREQELALLLGRWRQAEAGEGQVVLLSGEPGIGKSRLVLALRDRLRDEPCTILRYQCSPYYTNTALWPVLDQLERGAGFLPHEPSEAKLDKLEALLARAVPDPGEAAPFVAALLGIATQGRYPDLELTPQQRKARTFDALLDQLEGLARQRSVLAAFEDAQWADATTLELLDLTIERLQRLPALMVVTFRPEFRPPWTSHTHATLLTLNRLGVRQAAAIVDRVAGGKALPAEVLDQVLARTDGVPLFVEELTKAVLELELLREEDGRYVLAGPLPATAIPSTLHGSLLARLDRLAPVKEVAQVGAVIGREFEHRVLAAVAPLPEDRLAAALDELIGAELVFRRGLPPDAVYVFKHALVQEAAYASLLRSRRQQLHARVARVLEERFPEVAAARPEILARHCAEAGLGEKALDYWWRAGRAALAQSAPAEAIGHLRQALGPLECLPDTDDRAKLELEIRTALGSALMGGTTNFGAPETGETFARARELCRRLGDTERLFPVIFGQWAYNLTRGELGAAGELAAETLRWAEERGDDRLLATAHRLVGVSALWGGRPGPAREHLEKALASHDRVPDQYSALRYAWDQRVATLVCLALALWLSGHPEQALARAAEGLAQARRLSHAPTLAHALCQSCLLQHVLGDRRTACEQAQALGSLCSKHRLHLPMWVTMANAIGGAEIVGRTRADQDVVHLAECLRRYRDTGCLQFVPYWLALLAEAFLEVGRGPEALAALAEALKLTSATGQCWPQAELHRLRGHVLLRLDPKRTADAEAAFDEAISIARGQTAPMWELRAACDLARLWAEQGERRKAHDLLAPIRGWFTEGLDTPDLEKAGALLHTLC